MRVLIRRRRSLKHPPTNTAGGLRGHYRPAGALVNVAQTHQSLPLRQLTDATGISPAAAAAAAVGPVRAVARVYCSLVLLEGVSNDDM